MRPTRALKRSRKNPRWRPYPACDNLTTPPPARAQRGLPTHASAPMTDPDSPQRRFSSVRRHRTREEIRRYETVEDSAVYVLSNPERANHRRATGQDVTVGQRYDRDGNLKRIHPNAAKLHGTPGCYQNSSCRCAWVPGTGPWTWYPEHAVIPLADVANIGIPGCERAATAVSSARRERKRMDAPTVRIPLRTDTGERHTQRSSDTAPPAEPPPAGPAFTLGLFTAGAQPA